MFCLSVVFIKMDIQVFGCSNGFSYLRECKLLKLIREYCFLIYVFICRFQNDETGIVGESFTRGKQGISLDILGDA